MFPNVPSQSVLMHWGDLFRKLSAYGLYFAFSSFSKNWLCLSKKLHVFESTTTLTLCADTPRKLEDFFLSSFAFEHF